MARHFKLQAVIDAGSVVDSEYPLSKKKLWNGWWGVVAFMRRN